MTRRGDLIQHLTSALSSYERVGKMNSIIHIGQQPRINEGKESKWGLLTLSSNISEASLSLCALSSDWSPSCCYFSHWPLLPLMRMGNIWLPAVFSPVSLFYHPSPFFPHWFVKIYLMNKSFFLLPLSQTGVKVHLFLFIISSNSFHSILVETGGFFCHQKWFL